MPLTVSLSVVLTVEVEGIARAEAAALFIESLEDAPPLVDADGKLARITDARFIR